MPGVCNYGFVMRIETTTTSLKMESLVETYVVSRSPGLSKTILQGTVKDERRRGRIE